MGGGGGQTGGTVVGGPSMGAALLAGQYQSSAAQAAADAAQQSINDAINAMNRNYQQARYDMQPYRTEGVQALNQLNQYLGLDAYNPGKAPVAPKKYTAEDLASEVSKNQIRNYITQNTGMVGVGNNHKQTFTHLQYQGAGSEDPALQAAYAKQWAHTPAGEKMPGGGLTLADSNDNNFGSGLSPFTQNPAIQQAARLELADELARNKNATYDTDLEAYNRNLEEYNQNKAWYDQYTAEGPYTQEQISDKISNLPGYQAQLTQGSEAINKSASSKGYLGSGRVLKELMNFGQNTLSQFYGNELDRLASLAGAGQQAAGISAQGSLNKGNALAGLYQSLGDTKANAALASGNALAQSLLAANQQYKVIGQQDSGGGGLGGIGSVLGGIGSIASAFMAPSSRDFKDHVNTPTTKEILDNVNKLEINRWKYKNIPEEHLGPYAEQFHDLFNVGHSKAINLVDVCGILLASVQELSQQIDSLKDKLTQRNI